MGIPSAEGDEVESENGIRFVQVAAGEDFAIGLTYDGDLYGWSLKGNTTRNTDQENLSVTLGDYYTSTPTKINVKYILGPGSTAVDWSTGVGIANDKGYHWEREDDKIKKIVATRSTAAFLTEKGYIYTWGKDTNASENTVENVHMGESNPNQNPHYLLMRMISDNYPWHTPYMINYNYYGTTDPMRYAMPEVGSGLNAQSFDIAAGEYNYIIKYQNNSQQTYSYVWGSLLYNAANRAKKSGYNYTDTIADLDKGDLYGGAQVRLVVLPSSNVDIVAGGYNVGFNNATVGNGTNLTTLQLRGRNFLSSQYDVENGYVLTMSIASTATSNILYNPGGDDKVTVTVEGGIAGGQSSTGTASSEIYNGVDLSTFYGTLSGGTSTIKFEGPSTATIKGAHDNSLEKIPGTEANSATAYRYGVSLGNDVGYGIAGGSLYGWGDNAQGQLGNENGGSSPTPTLIASDVANFVSVAAGKQLSANNKPFNAVDTLVTGKVNDEEGNDEEGNKIIGFSPDVQNKADFISGAITNDGKLYVWSNNSTTPTEIKYGLASTVTDSDKFVAVYSGYGNNLFAITKMGKLIRVQFSGGDYTQYRYDTFNDGTKNIVNWEIEDGNTVAFAPVAPGVGEDAVVSPDLGKATFYVWGATIEGKTEQNPDRGIVTVNEENGYKPLVKSNAIGDVYRIMLSGDDEKLPESGVRGGKFLSDNGSATSFKPVFKYGNGTDYGAYTAMTDVQQQNMFTVEYLNDANGVGIKITPKKSSKGYTIAMEFYVARYNSTENFSAEGGDTAQYYDYKACRITFTIADTPVVKTYKEYDATNGDKSTVPLLDPNNDYNKSYSIAAQDVSSGVRELLKTIGVTDANIDGVMSKVIADMTAKDKGFPAKSKIEKGNLTYYLGDDVGTRYYTDVYKFLYTDRDGDFVTIDKFTGGIISGGAAGSMEGETAKVHISDIDTGIAVTEQNTVDAIKTKIAKEFDNVYGIYDVDVKESDSHTALLSFRYDVVTLTAKTSSGFIAYGEGGISDFQTTEEYYQARVWANLSASVSAIGYTASFEGIKVTQESKDIDAQYAVAAFSQPSLRITRDYSGRALEDENHNPVVYSGNFGGNNVYTEEYRGTIIVGDSVEINLDNYFNTRSGYILYSYDGASSRTAFDEFEGLFADQTSSFESNVAIKPVALSASKLTVTPTTALPINLTVTVKRYSNANATAGFGTEDKPDETLEINIIFNNIVDFSFQKATQSTSEHDAEYMITKAETINVTDGRFITISNVPGQDGLTSTKINSLLQKVKISRPVVSENNNVFTVSGVTSNSFVITPVSSGTGYIKFTASIYNKSLVFTLAINVSAVTTFSDTADIITVVDDKYISVDEIKSKLAKANSFNSEIGKYNVLYDDVANPEAALNDRKFNALYFTNSQGVVETPIFVRNAIIEKSNDKYNIRIITSSNATSVQEQYYLHVKFTNAVDISTYDEAPDGSVIEAVYVVKSGMALLPVSINIDTKDLANSKVAGTLASGEAASSTISLTAAAGEIQVSLTDLLKAANVSMPSEYSVVILRADEGTSKYFGYRTDTLKTTIILTPNYNTPDVDSEDIPNGPELTISATNGSEYTVITFNVSVSGVLTVLPVMQENGVIGYGNIWIYSAIIVFGVLAIIFIIRMIVYWKKRSKQRAIIKRNQELIRMRDRIHAKGTAATREQMVKTKLKMGDPKYAKMMNEMRKNKQEENGGVILENPDIASTTIDTKSKKNKKKKGGKKTVAELKAELEAKKAAFAAAQAQSAQPVNPFEQEVPMDGGGFDAPGGDFVSPDADFGGAQSINGGEIIFDATDVGDGM